MSLLHGLSTARLDFAPLAAADEGALVEAIDWDREEAAVTGWTLAKLPALFAPSAGQLAAALRRDATLVGAVLATPRERTLELDGLVLPAWRGVGFAAESLAAIAHRALSDSAAQSRAFDAVRVTVRRTNTAAIRAARALGFVAESMGDAVSLTATDVSSIRERVLDARLIERLIETLGAFEARMLVNRNESRAGRELPPLRRHSFAIDELADLPPNPRGDFEAARQACGPFGTIDRAALTRAAVGLSDAEIAELQKMVRTSHNSASEYAEAMSADALLRRVRKVFSR